MATWQEKCRALGGTPTVFPNPTARYPSPGGDPGAPACRLGDGLSVPFAWYSADMTVLERLTRTATLAEEAKDRALGDVVAFRDKVLAATGLDKGLSGVVAKLVGLPRWVLVVGAVALGALVLVPLVRPYLKREGGP